MEEILYLLRENNQMLRRICAYLDKVDSKEYRDTRDLKDLMTNLVADLYTNNLKKNLRR